MKILLHTRYWVLFFFCLPLFLQAKTPKPKILIYGSTLEAYVAALQSAASGVPTLWVNPENYSLNNDRKLIREELLHQQLDGGVVHHFMDSPSKSGDSTGFFTNEKKQSYSVLSPYPPLLISTNEDVTKIVQSKTWKITLSNRKSYDVITVLDASSTQALSKKTNLKNFPSLKYKNGKDLSVADSRSIVLLGEVDTTIYTFTLPDLLTQKDNFFVLSQDLDLKSKKFQLAYGQVMGAIAGYCAFFKTTADKIDLRTLQNELLMFRSRLLPTIDVTSEDKNFMYLQRMYLAGILPVHVKDDKPFFNLEDSVRVSDIKTVVNQYYSRAQLWFVDNNPEYLTVGDALNLIKFTAFRGEELDAEAKRMWNKELTFKGEFDPSKVITRYQFAVLFDKYASPFVKKVSQDGGTIYR